MARILVRRGRAQGVTRAALVAALVVCASPASAQTQDNPANPRRPFRKLFTDVGSDFTHLPSRDTLLWLSVGGAAALAVHPLDAT
jgi:hypothetical protein